MSRFSNLEFGGKDKPARQPQGSGEEVRDEHFYHERALAAYLAGDFEESLLNHSRALEKNPAYYDGWFGQLRMLIELGEYSEAKVWADRAMEFFPEHPELLSAKAVAAVREAEFDLARMLSDNAIEKRDVTSYAWLARAEVLLARRSRMAPTCLSNAVALGGSEAPRVRLEAGRLLMAYKNYPAALAYLQAATRELPQSALAWYELARCQAKLGLPDTKTLFEQCLRLRPGWSAAGEALSRYENRGPAGRLIDWMKRFFSSPPQMLKKE